MKGFISLASNIQGRCEPMVEILADVGGSPGKDCRGFCKYCYFKLVKNVPSFGYKY